jgi:hypothetical protein
MRPSILKFLKENAITIFWLVVAGFIMSWFIWRGCCTRFTAYLWIGAFTSSMWIALWMGNAYLSQLLDYFISWHKDPVKRLGAGLVGMVVYTVSAVYGLVFLYKSVLGFNVGDQLDSTYYSSIFITLIITMFMTSRSFLVNWRESAVDAERAKKESVAAQYESLKNQVNPHFLFNSLNALTNLVYEDQDKAAKFIKQLSEVYRYVLDTRDKELVALAEEVKFLDSYLYLQQIRFGEKLNLKVSLENATGHVAPLALQMLIENAIKHNVIAEDQPLFINVKVESGFIVVENNLQQKNIPSEGSSGIGLENIQKRYEFLSNQKVIIENTGDVFRVKLPVIV